MNVHTMQCAIRQVYLPAKSLDHNVAIFGRFRPNRFLGLAVDVVFRAVVIGRIAHSDPEGPGGLASDGVVEEPVSFVV